MALPSLCLHFLEWGRETGPTVLLLLGIRGHARMWEFLAPDLEGGYRRIALDQRGHGDSHHPRPPASCLADYLADLEGFVRALGLGELVLRGHSMGALHALAYTAAHRRRVRGLIYVDMDPRPPDYQWQRLHEAGARPQREFATVEEALETERRIALGGPASGPLPPVLRRFVEQNLRQREDGRLVSKLDQEALRHFDRYDLWPLVPRVSCPALVVRGPRAR